MKTPSINTIKKSYLKKQEELKKLYIEELETSVIELDNDETLELEVINEIITYYLARKSYHDLIDFWQKLQKKNPSNITTLDVQIASVLATSIESLTASEKLKVLETLSKNGICDSNTVNIVKEDICFMPKGEEKDKSINKLSEIVAKYGIPNLDQSFVDYLITNYKLDSITGNSMEIFSGLLYKHNLLATKNNSLELLLEDNDFNSYFNKLFGLIFHSNFAYGFAKNTAYDTAILPKEARLPEEISALTTDDVNVLFERLIKLMKVERKKEAEASLTSLIDPSKRHIYIPFFRESFDINQMLNIYYQDLGELTRNEYNPLTTQIMSLLDYQEDDVQDYFNTLKSCTNYPGTIDDLKTEIKTNQQLTSAEEMPGSNQTFGQVQSEIDRLKAKPKSEVSVKIKK